MGKSAFSIFFVYVSVLRVGRGVDWGWMHLPTHPQQYCDPASLVHPDDTDYCEEETCSGNGKCFNSALMAKCKCNPGFTGKYCQGKVTRPNTRLPYSRVGGQEQCLRRVTKAFGLEQYA